MRSMNYLQLASIGAFAVVAIASFGARSHADAIPSGWEASNMEPVGYSGLENRKGAFKMAIKKVNGRWYLYMGHLWHYGWSIVDVTEPKDPKFLKTISCPGNTWTIQMTLRWVLTWTPCSLRQYSPSPMTCAAAAPGFSPAPMR